MKLILHFITSQKTLKNILGISILLQGIRLFLKKVYQYFLHLLYIFSLPSSPIITDINIPETRLPIKQKNSPREKLSISVPVHPCILRHQTAVWVSFMNLLATLSGGPLAAPFLFDLPPRRSSSCCSIL